MVTEGTSASEQREQTDESLRVEREQVDGVLAVAQGAGEETADRAVQRARENSDAVLTAARERADQRMEVVLASQVEAGATIAEERLLEDRGVQNARDRADAALSVAREKADQVLENAVSQAAVSTATIAEERLLEDKIRRNERAFVDGSLRRERDENASILARLLPLERENTDRYLLTERARADAAVSSRDDFLAMVSHDLRSLLGGIVMYADLLSADAPEDKAGRHTTLDTQHIQRYAARMNRLIGDLVDVVSIDAGKLAVIPFPCDSGLLISEAIDTFQGAAALKSISLSFAGAGKPLMALCDRGRMLQVLANLITNAMKFTEFGGRISVQGERVGNQLQFSVTDTGSGIPANMLEAIFERFWQAGKDDKRGLGLGLYISRCIVEAHGGKIWAESTLGLGSTISFTVDAAA